MPNFKLSMVEIFQIRTLSEKNNLFLKILNDFSDSDCTCFFSTYRFDSFALNNLKKLGILDSSFYIFVDRKNILLSKKDIMSKNLFVFPQSFLAFHSKTYLFFNRSKIHLLVGNLNLSEEGLTENTETMVHISASYNDLSQITGILQTFQFFKELFLINKKESYYDSLMQKVNSLINLKPPIKPTVFFLHSLNKSLFSQINQLINLSSVTKVRALSPIFIEEGDLIPILLKKGLKIDIILQKQNNSLGQYINIRKNNNLSFYQLSASHLNHSKIYSFYRGKTLIASFIGSPNFAKTAFFNTKELGNIESGILIIGDNPHLIKFIRKNKIISNLSNFSIKKNRYLDEDKLKKLVNVNKKNSLPITLCWELTSSCNNNCSFCYVRNKNKSFFLDKKYIRKLIYGAKKSGIFSQWITGGEPFLYFDLLLYSINLANQYGIDTEKISTSLNFDSKTISDYFLKLSQSSFVRNSLFKGQLNVGIGHQEIDKNGKFNEKKFMNILKGINNFYNFFDIKRNNIKLSVTDSPVLNYSFLYKKFLKKNLNPSILVDHFDVVKKKQSKFKSIPAKEFDFNSYFDCSDYFLEPCSWPMIFIKSNGDIYGCITWFLERNNLLFLGNLKTISLSKAIKKLRTNKILKFLKSKGIHNLYNLVSKQFPILGNLRVPQISNETAKCFVCREILSNKKYLSYLNKIIK